MESLPAKLCKQITEPGSGDRSKALFSVIRKIGKAASTPSPSSTSSAPTPMVSAPNMSAALISTKRSERVLSLKPGQPHETGKDQLLRNEEGKIRSNLANAIAALRLAPDWQSVLGLQRIRPEDRDTGKARWLSGPPDQPLEWASVDDI